MKVILKQGRDGFMGTCRKCGCEFKYTLSDISFDYVYCPYCSTPVYHPDQSLQDPESNINKKGFWKIR